MRQALELFHSKAYLKAEKLFVEAKPDRPVDAAKYLFLIAEKLGRNDLDEKYNAYLSELVKEGNGEEFLAFHESRLKKLHNQNRLFYLTALWSEGKIDRFLTEGKEFWKTILENKYYAVAEKLFFLIQERKPFFLSNYFAYLTYLAEVERLDDAAEKADAAFKLIRDHWRKTDHASIARHEAYSNLLNILRDVQTMERRLAAVSLACQLEILLTINADPSPRFVIEYCITFKDDRTALRRLLSLKALPSKTVLEEHLANDPGQRPVRSHIKKTDAAETLASGKLVEQILATPTATFCEEDKGEETISVSSEEKEIIRRIEARDQDFFGNVAGAVHSLIGIGFHTAALTLIEKSDKDKRESFAFLKCHALWELKEYLKLLDFASELAGEMNVENQTPFYHLAAKAALKLGKKNEAYLLLKEVMKNDPNYRDTKELLRSAKA